MPTEMMIYINNLIDNLGDELKIVWANMPLQSESTNFYKNSIAIKSNRIESTSIPISNPTDCQL